MTSIRSSRKHQHQNPHPAPSLGTNSPKKRQNQTTALCKNLTSHQKCRRNPPMPTSQSRGPVSVLPTINSTATRSLSSYSSRTTHHQTHLPEAITKQESTASPLAVSEQQPTTDSQRLQELSERLFLHNTGLYNAQLGWWCQEADNNCL